MNELLASFHKPQLVGTLRVVGKAQCLGWCQDPQNTLVALAAIGSVTSVRAVWATIAQQGKGLQLYINDQNYNTSYAHSREHKFEIYWSPVPKSNFLSMIALNEGLFGIPKERETVYLPITGNRDDMAARLYARVKEIVFLPVKREWSHYLYEEGEMNRLCGPLLDGHSEGFNRLSTKGFSVLWLTTQKERWEKLITTGLAQGKISI